MLANWLPNATGHVFHLSDGGERGLVLRDLGPREDACAEPINVVYDKNDRWQPISNLAHTPFELDGRLYASIEGFWQGLKFASAQDRERIAALWGQQAKAAGWSAPAEMQFIYEGETIDVGRHRHWRLMARACRAKFLQNAEARQALEATGDRPLTHRVRKDSQTIPGVVMADIWMRVRQSLRRVPTEENPSEPAP